MTDRTDQGPIASDGWYKDAADPTVEREWVDGRWNGHTRLVEPGGPIQSPPPHWPSLVALAIAVGGCGLAAFTTVSLASGMGQVVFGAVLAVIGVLVAFMAGASSAVRLICAILAVVAIGSAVSDQHQLDQIRQDLRSSLNEIGQP